MNELREFDKRSRYFPLGDHFINSHNLISRHCINIVGIKLTLDTIGTKKLVMRGKSYMSGYNKCN